MQQVAPACLHNVAWQFEKYKSFFCILKKKTQKIMNSKPKWIFEKVKMLKFWSTNQISFEE